MLGPGASAELAALDIGVLVFVPQPKYVVTAATSSTNAIPSLTLSDPQAEELPSCMDPKVGAVVSTTGVAVSARAGDSLDTGEAAGF